MTRTQKPTLAYWFAGTAAALVSMSLGCLIFGLACNESLNEEGLEGAICGGSDAIVLASLVAGLAGPLAVGRNARRGRSEPRTFTAVWVLLVLWAAVLVFGAVAVG